MNLRSLCAALPLALALGAAARAAESPLDAMFACQSIADDSGRLACLDREVAKLRDGTKSGKVMAVDRKQLEVESYGLNRSSAPLPATKVEGVANAQPAGGSSAADRIVRDTSGQIQAMENLAVASLDRTAYGQLIVKLQNGQLWVQTDRIQLLDSRRKPQEESTVSIGNAALGSHQMQLNGAGPWFRVRRVN